MCVLLLQSQTLTIVLTTHVLMVHRAWMESIAIGVTAQWDSLGRIVKQVGVSQKMFTSISASIIMKMLLLFLCNLLSDINDCVNHSCANGAVCVDGIDSYSCNCTMGFTGAYCETGN